MGSEGPGLESAHPYGAEGAWDGRDLGPALRDGGPDLRRAWLRRFARRDDADPRGESAGMPEGPPRSGPGRSARGCADGPEPSPASRSPRRGRLLGPGRAGAFRNVPGVNASDGSPGRGSTLWRRALLAASVFALRPAGVGVIVRGGPGPARDAWLRHVRALLPAGVAVRRVPSTISVDRLLGSVDLAATLKGRRMIRDLGVLDADERTILVLASAERLPVATAAIIATAFDESGGADRRFGFIALDEGREEGEGLPEALREQAAFAVDLDGIALADIDQPCADLDLDAARVRFSQAQESGAALETLVAAAGRLGIESLRAPLDR